MLRKLTIHFILVNILICSIHAVTVKPWIDASTTGQDSDYSVNSGNVHNNSGRSGDQAVDRRSETRRIVNNESRNRDTRKNAPSYEVNETIDELGPVGTTPSININDKTNNQNKQDNHTEQQGQIIRVPLSKGQLTTPLLQAKKQDPVPNVHNTRKSMIKESNGEENIDREVSLNNKSNADEYSSEEDEYHEQNNSNTSQNIGKDNTQTITNNKDQTPQENNKTVTSQGTQNKPSSSQPANKKQPIGNDSNRPSKTEVNAIEPEQIWGKPESDTKMNKTNIGRQSVDIDDRSAFELACPEGKHIYNGKCVEED